MKIFSDQTLFLRPARSDAPPGAPTLWDGLGAATQLAPGAATPASDFDDAQTRFVTDADPWAATRDTPTPLNLDGLIAGHYEILKPQAAGAHSAVYLAEDVTTGALVILKTVSGAHLHSDAAHNMLLRAEALRGIAARGAPECRGVFYDQGRLFVAMERVRGVSLQHLIAAGEGFSFDSAPGLLEAVLHILKGCHTRGYLHGDIKPSNIVLIDWGASQQQSEAFQVVSLTPKFASPETYSRYAGAQRGQIGAWSDIYSAFSTAAVCLIGGQDRVTPEAVQAALTTEAGRADSLPDAAFDAIAALFATGLAADPTQRFQTASAAIAEIATVRDTVFRKARGLQTPNRGGGQVFISYSRKDAGEVGRMIEALQQIGLSPWVDQSSIHAGDDWMAEIVAALKKSALVIVYCTENSVGADQPSRHVRREIDLAFEARKRVAPVFPAGQNFALDDSAAYLLSGLHRQDWTGDGPAFADALRALL